MKQIQVFFSVWLPSNTGYRLEEQGEWIELRPPSAFPSLEGVAQWVGDGRTYRAIAEAQKRADSASNPLTRV